MAEEKVKLYGVWASAFSKRVEVALKMKGIEYDYFEEDLGNKSPDLLHYNPVHKKIPVLVHGDKAIAESQVIIEYIDETWDSGAPILPRDPYQRALARFWARFFDDKFIPSMHKTIVVGDEKANEEALENLNILEQELGGRRFFGGESIGFVDIVANLLGFWVGVFEEVTGKAIITDEAFPSICKWKNEFMSCDVIRETLPPRDKLVEYVGARVEAARAKLSSK